MPDCYQIALDAMQDSYLCRMVMEAICIYRYLLGTLVRDRNHYPDAFWQQYIPLTVAHRTGKLSARSCVSRLTGTEADTPALRWTA